MNIGYLIKLASDVDYSEIASLQKQKNRSLLGSILAGMGQGSRYGLGIGGVGGALAGGVGLPLAARKAFDYTAESLRAMGRDISPEEVAQAKQSITVPAIFGGGVLGGLGGGLGGTALGTLIGGVYGGLTHGSKKQRAIERLKELGIEDV